jgi:hypothetical protein
MRRCPRKLGGLVPRRELRAAGETGCGNNAETATNAQLFVGSHMLNR